MTYRQTTTSWGQSAAPGERAALSIHHLDLATAPLPDGWSTNTDSSSQLTHRELRECDRVSQLAQRNSATQSWPCRALVDQVYLERVMNTAAVHHEQSMSRRRSRLAS